MTVFENTRRGSVAQLIQARQTELGTTDQQIAEALGYDSTKIITMIKRGSMKMPIIKVTELAGVLDVDAAYLLRLVLRENDPVLFDVLERVLGPATMTQEEIGVLHTMRAMKTELDDLQEDPEFAGRSILELAIEGEIKMREIAPDPEDANAVAPRRQLRISLVKPVTEEPAALDRLGDPLKVTAKEALMIYAYRAASTGNPQTVTLALPSATVVVVPKVLADN